VISRRCGNETGIGIQDKITGRIKQAAGDLKGDDKLRAKGIAEERKGEAKEELEQARAEADAKASEVANLERATAKQRARSRP
jgi:uncharacterized protein YjbJ (UPF0337 family)